MRRSSDYFVWKGTAFTHAVTGGRLVIVKLPIRESASRIPKVKRGRVRSRFGPDKAK